MKKHIGLSLVVLCVSACGTVMTKETCQSTNWVEKGREEGASGLSFENIDKYKEACAKNKITIEEKLYVAGYLEGLKTYCTQENGYKRGVKGGRPHTCPEDSPYLVGYNEGIEKHQADKEERKIRELTRQTTNNTDVGAPVVGGAPGM